MAQILKGKLAEKQAKLLDVYNPVMVTAHTESLKSNEPMAIACIEPDCTGLNLFTLTVNWIDAGWVVIHTQEKSVIELWIESLRQEYGQANVVMFDKNRVN